MERLRLATVWLAGCSGCHMSFLDLDEWLVDLAGLVDLVYSPFIDVKQYPQDVDVVLVEGAVANVDNLEFLRTVRQRSRTLISFGDCAVTGNVTALRNCAGSPDEILKDCYTERADVNPQPPGESDILPILLDRVVPVHAMVAVDHYLPGCPPDAGRIRAALESLVQGRGLELSPEQIRFG